MTHSSGQAHRPWAMFFGWLLVGVLWMTVIAGIASIGIFVLPLAAVATWFVARRPEPRRGMAALVAIAGLPFFLLARLNRNTQGTVLRGTGGGPVTGFVSTNPWPWVAVGTMMLGASVVVFLVMTRRRA